MLFMWISVVTEWNPLKVRKNKFEVVTNPPHGINTSKRCCCQDPAPIRVFPLRWTRAWCIPVKTWPGRHLAGSVRCLLSPVNMQTEKWVKFLCMPTSGDSLRGSTFPNPWKPFTLKLVQVYGLMFSMIRCGHTSRMWWRVETDSPQTITRKA